jgi:hypothetical protein
MNPGDDPTPSPVHPIIERPETDISSIMDTHMFNYAHPLNWSTVQKTEWSIGFISATVSAAASPGLFPERIVCGGGVLDHRSVNARAEHY